MRKKISIIIATAVLLASLVLVSTWLFVNWSINRQVQIAEPVRFTINPGSGSATVFYQLSTKRIIDMSPSLMVWLVYLTQGFRHPMFKPGIYLVEQGATLSSLTRKFINADVLRGKVTLIEGETTGNFLRKFIASEGLNLNDFPQNALGDRRTGNPIMVSVPASLTQELLHRLVISYPSLEGMFLSDTYVYKYGDRGMVLLQNAHANLMRELNALWNTRPEGLPYKNSYEALIMASIIEKETGNPGERPLVASVFINRLKKGMRLQTDPTIIYGMGESYRGRIGKRALTTPGPYNSYLNNGLPPTPISNVGIAALRAAFYPTPSKYLYFVAKGDGTHYFSTTLKEHNSAVKKYQVNRSADYRSFR